MQRCLLAFACVNWCGRVCVLCCILTRFALGFCMATAPCAPPVQHQSFWDLRFLRVVRLSRVLRTLGPNSRLANLGALVWRVIVMSALGIPLYFLAILSIVGQPLGPRGPTTQFAFARI